MSRHTFHDLASVIDDVHALFDAWTDAGAFSPPLNEEGVEVLRLAVHEWVANLVQHAAFPNGAVVTLEMEVDGQGVSCAIEDSSVGFDFAGQVEHQQAVMDAPAPSERGRGLLMLVTCTEALTFRPASAGQRQRIGFRVIPPTPGGVFEPLFRPEDLTDEPSLLSPSSGDGLATGEPHPAASSDRLA